uniref:Uncharacterized protein n=1 Tax=Arundo donax TaxID=35708 RepID=A0A0A9CAX0_ARUDO
MRTGVVKIGLETNTLFFSDEGMIVKLQLDNHTLFVQVITKALV